MKMSDRKKIVFQEVPETPKHYLGKCPVVQVDEVNYFVKINGTWRITSYSYKVSKEMAEILDEVINEQ